jgi:hypothetical protein
MGVVLSGRHRGAFLSRRRWPASWSIAFVALAAFHTDNSSDVDCAGFRVTPDRWASASYDERVDLQDGIAQCKTLENATRDTVIAALGAPDRDATGELDYNLPLPGEGDDRQVWRIYLDDATRVKSTQTESPETGAP